MNKEERVLKYINSSTELVFAEKYYCEADFYEDIENILKENFKTKKTKGNWLSIVAGSIEICPEFYQLSLDTEDYEILYDLIKADLVEKVEDK